MRNSYLLAGVVDEYVEPVQEADDLFDESATAIGVRDVGGDRVPLPASLQIADLVATRQFDLGVMELPMSKSGVDVQPLPPAPIVAVLPAGHRLASQDRLASRDLAGERLVVPSPQSYLRYQIDDAFNRQGITPEVVAETPTSPLVCALVAEGAGIGLVSAWTPSPHGDTRLVQRPFSEPLQSQYACVRAAGAVPMVLAEEFQAMLAKQMQETFRTR